MAPATEDLKNAIQIENLARVQELLTPRNALGLPLIDVNKGFDFAETALLWALICKPINIQIIQTLLDIRDNAGNPVINLRHIICSGCSVFSLILDSSVPARLRPQLLQSVLDVRGPHGELIADLTVDQSYNSLLQKALEINDIDCLRILIDARLANGEKALNINEIRRGITILDLALKRNNPWYRYDVNIVNTIRAAGGVCAHDVLAHLRAPAPVPLPAAPAPAPLPVAPAPALSENKAIQQFNKNTQNTHDPSVTHTLKASVKALNDLYGIGLDEDGIILKLRDVIEKFDYSKLTVDKKLSNQDKKSRAKTFLGFMQKRCDFLHSHSNLRFRRIYALIWKAVNDDSLDVLPDEIRRTLNPTLTKTPYYLIETRQAALVEKFIEADLTYRSGGSDKDICDGGSIHKLLESLNHSHNAIVICTGMFSVKPAANETAISVLTKILRTKPIRIQRQILSSWDADDEKSEAASFKRESVPIIDVALQDRFGTLLTKTDREEITGQYEYFPMPIIHHGLNKLINQINELSDTINQHRAAAIFQLKELANKTYDKSELSFDEEYKILSQKFNEFSEINNITSDYDDVNFECAKNRLMFHFKNSLVTEKNTDQTCYSFRQEFNAFIDFHKNAQSLLKLKKKYLGNNPYRLKAISEIKLFVANSYLSYSNNPNSGNINEINQKLKNLTLELKREALADHKQNGALSWLFLFQPPSRFVKNIDLIINDRKWTMVR